METRSLRLAPLRGADFLGPGDPVVVVATLLDHRLQAGIPPEWKTGKISGEAIR